MQPLPAAASEHIAIIWMVAGALLVMLEALSVPGIGLLFAGLSAICVGGLLTFSLVQPDNIILQLTCFFVLTAFWAVLLWRPLRHLRQSGQRYTGLVGSTAEVIGTLEKNVQGQVKWSGTIMNAVLAPDSTVSLLPEGTKVTVLSIQGTTLTVVLHSPSLSLSNNEGVAS